MVTVAIVALTIVEMVETNVAKSKKKGSLRATFFD
jgi:hypothetical protein